MTYIVCGRKFDTLEAASKVASEIFRETNVVVAIEAERTLYLRKEQTTDSTLIAMEPKAAKKKKDVCMYYDKEAKHFAGRIPWHYTNCPTKRNKYTMLNCNRYRIEWI